MQLIIFLPPVRAEGTSGGKDVRSRAAKATKTQRSASSPSLCLRRRRRAFFSAVRRCCLVSALIMTSLSSTSPSSSSSSSSCPSSLTCGRLLFMLGNERTDSHSLRPFCPSIFVLLVCLVATRVTSPRPLVSSHCLSSSPAPSSSSCCCVASCHESLASLFARESMMPHLTLVASCRSSFSLCLITDCPPLSDVLFVSPPPLTLSLVS